MQAMAMGVPTITTNWSGIAAFTTADTVLYVNHAEREVPSEARKIYNLPDGATWAEPDAEHLGTLMRQMRAMSAAERKALGDRAMQHVRTEFSQEKVGLQIAERVVSIERTVRRRWADQGRPAAKPALGEGVERLEVKQP
jgi:glycosyltransferase involved in cell wall biosynthesis